MPVEPPGSLSEAHVLASLPAPWPDASLRERIHQRHLERAETLVVIDDDPTGCQTVADVPLLLSWNPETLRAELAARPPVLYILTNSRARPEDEARRLNQQLASQLRAAAVEAGRAIAVVSRSDSTLRGHFPAETDALTDELGPFDGILLAPYFADGGRLTINNIHYVRRGSELVPAAATEFAQDPVFGYASSNLREWAAEKSHGRWAAAEVGSLTLDDIRQGGPERIAQQLARWSGGRPLIVNAACDRDVEVVAWALLQAEVAQRTFLPRTAASFVKVRAGLPDRPLLSVADLGATPGGPGGLVVVGSYVPQSTAQLERLLALPGVRGFELNVDNLLASAAQAHGPRQLATATAAAAAEAMAAGQVAVVFTSRAFAAAGAGALDTGRRIGAALCDVVRELPLRPAYLIAKGGITSHELAQNGLGCRRATVLGQVLPGVPVWRLDQAEHFPNLPYVVFPGNVGQPDSLRDLVQKLAAH